jgi:hypothetical protein
MKRAFFHCFIVITAIIVSAVNITSAVEANAKKLPEINFRTETWTLNTPTGPLVRRTLMVITTFPEIPDFTCESWCYENDVDFIGVDAIKGGGIEFRHRDRNDPNVVIVTTVTAEPGAVEFLAHAELAAGAKGKLPEKLLTPNLCWQLVKAPNFASKPDTYPDFVKRCFIFTEKGRTFLNETTRKPIPCREPNDPYNNPPWVQMYVGTWQESQKATASSWADTSPDRYTTTVIGTVSRDGKYLAALANDSATLMCQAWHDCMHNNATWAPADAPPQQQRWRLKLYVMENDPDKLLARVAKDFPNAMHRGK